MNQILFIDTCGSRLVLSLIINEKIIDIQYIPTNKNMVDIFNNEIDNIFKSNNINKKKINKIYVINGPGSFVGVKIGIVFANLFTFLNNSELFYLDSCSFQSTKEKSISLLDARSNLFYTKITDIDNEISLMTQEEVTNISIKYNLKIVNDYNNYKFELCWKKNKSKFIKTYEVKGNYVKDPV